MENIQADVGKHYVSGCEIETETALPRLEFPASAARFVETLKALATWAQREHHAVGAALLRMQAPKVPEKEMETDSTEQLNTLFAATPPGWATLAIQILLGTGMRLAELCALTIDDVEDEGEVTFLKIRSGKGAKFRRVPISSRLRSLKYPTVSG